MLVDDDVFYGVLKIVGIGLFVEFFGSNLVDECNKYVRDVNNDMVSFLNLDNVIMVYV